MLAITLLRSDKFESLLMVTTPQPGWTHCLLAVGPTYQYHCLLWSMRPWSVVVSLFPSRTPRKRGGTPAKNWKTGPDFRMRAFFFSCFKKLCSLPSIRFLSIAVNRTMPPTKSLHVTDDCSAHQKMDRITNITTTPDQNT